MDKKHEKRYKVSIELNKDSLKTQDSINEFLETQFPDLLSNNKDNDEATVELISLNGHSLELFWNVPEMEGGHEIENELFYILNDGIYGTYSYEYVR